MCFVKRFLGLGGCYRSTPGSDMQRTRFPQGLSPTRTHRPIFGLMRPPSVRARRLSIRFNCPLLPCSRKPSPRRSREGAGRAVSLCARRHDGRARRRSLRGQASFAWPASFNFLRPASLCSSSFVMKPSSPNSSSCGNEQRTREPQESRWPQCRQQGRNRSHRFRG